MIVENQAAATGAARVYHLRHMYLYAGGFLLLCLGMAGFMLGLPLSMDEPLDTASQVVIVVGAAILAALGIAICVAFLNIRLVAGPVGITYYNWGVRLRTNWDNIEGTGELWTTRGMIRGLQLREPALEMDGWMRIGRGAIPVMSTIGALSGRGLPRSGSMAGYDRIIPVGYFAQDWETSDLGALIRRYAPHALDPVPRDG
jgi:hypothetical protein